MRSGELNEISILFENLMHGSGLIHAERSSGFTFDGNQDSQFSVLGSTIGIKPGREWLKMLPEKMCCPRKT